MYGTQAEKTAGYKEEQDLLRRMRREKDRKARERLICGSLWMVRHIAGQFHVYGTAEDLVSVGTLGLIKAVDSYDSRKKNRLGCYAVRCIANEIRTYLRKEGAHMTVSLETLPDQNLLYREGSMEPIGKTYPEPQKAAEKAWELQCLAALLEKLPEMDRELLRLRFLEDRPMTQKETAEKLGTSQSYVSRREKKILAALRGGLEAE